MKNTYKNIIHRQNNTIWQKCSILQTVFRTIQFSFLTRYLNNKSKRYNLFMLGGNDDDVDVSPHTICPLLDIYTGNDAQKSDNAIE